MPEYRSRTNRAWFDDWWDASPATSITIHEDNDPVDTGLLDSKGHSIYRYPDTVAVGYRPKPKPKPKPKPRPSKKGY